MIFRLKIDKFAYDPEKCGSIPFFGGMNRSTLLLKKITPNFIIVLNGAEGQNCGYFCYYVCLECLDGPELI